MIELVEAIKIENKDNITFLTCHGWRCPKIIWQAADVDGQKHHDITRKGVIAHVSRVNRMIDKIHEVESQTKQLMP